MNKDQEHQPSMIDAIDKEMKKSSMEGIKAKVKKLLQTKREHEISIRQLDIQVTTLINDFENDLV